MLLGLVTDIHNHHENLARAIAVFDEKRVEQVVVIGDTCDAFAGPDGAEESVALLARCGAIGVWGNHDFSMCHDVADVCLRRYSSHTLDYMSRMRASLMIDDCHFRHKDASVDAYDVSELWAFEDESLELSLRAAAGLGAQASSRQFVGHYHRWWAATEAGPTDWDGTSPLRMSSEQRYFVVVAAVKEGHCATLDTTSGSLEPLCCSDK